MVVNPTRTKNFLYKKKSPPLCGGDFLFLAQSDLSQKPPQKQCPRMPVAPAILIYKKLSIDTRAHSGFLRAMALPALVGQFLRRSPPVA
jgi:hypothetical protein